MSVPFRKFHCQVCGHLYDEALGDPDSGIAPSRKRPVSPARAASWSTGTCVPPIE
jgi:rubredoxin